MAGASIAIAGSALSPYRWPRTSPTQASGRRKDDAGKVLLPASVYCSLRKRRGRQLGGSGEARCATYLGCRWLARVARNKEASAKQKSLTGTRVRSSIIAVNRAWAGQRTATGVGRRPKT